ncbi:MAG: ArnT family glycosyltransferase, partial [Gemmataceae bacterium]
MDAILRISRVRVAALPARLNGELIRVTVIVLVISLLFWHRLAERDLWGSHEARAAQDAQRMLDDGAWGLPRLFNDDADMQKPPLFYWLAATAGWLNGGVDAVSVRLLPALSASLCVALVYFVLRRRGRPLAAFIAALTLATAQHFTWLARTARIDMPLTLAVAVAVLAVVESRRWRAVGFVAMAAGLLLKGPVGLVLPLAVFVLAAFVECLVNLRIRAQPCRTLSPRLCGGRRQDEGGELVASAESPTPCPLPRKARGEGAQVRLPRGSVGSLLWGVPLALALSLPWFIWASATTHGEFFRVFFWYHNVQRALGGADELAVHPLWYYGPRLLVDALPASLVLLPAAVVFIRRGLWRTDSLARLGLVWLVAVVAVMSCAKFKRADYLLPAYPGLAIFLGCVGEQVWLAGRPQLRRQLAIGLATALAVVAGTWIYLLHVELPRHEPERELRSFARAIREVAPAPQVVLFFRAEAHALSFHLGRPVNTFLEWENLDVWAGEPGPHFVVMPPDCAARWRQHLSAGELEEVLRSTDLNGGRHERPLVLMRTRPKSETRDAPPRQQTADRARGDLRGAAGPEPVGPPGPCAHG